MKSVRAFQTSDGTIHQDELQAMMHEYMIECRGVIARDGQVGRSTTISSTDVAKCIARNGDQFAEVIRKYTNKVRGYHNRGKKLATEQVAA
jgi:hypothetical protein